MELTLIVVVLLVTFSVAVFTGYLFFGFLSAGPWVTVSKNDLVSFFSEYGEGEGKALLDLGSGDGRIVFSATGYGYKAHGIEINPILYFYSSTKAMILGNKKATFATDNLWKISYALYDVLTCYLFPKVREGVEKKFLEEGKAGAVMVFFKNGGGYDIVKK